MKTIIMAGGRGTRIAELFPDIPKPLIPIKDKNGISKPILEWEIESLRDQGFTDIVLTISYMADKIQNYFGNGSEFGVNVDYYIENTPHGNAGALFKIKDSLTEPFLLLNADAMFDVDFHRMVEFHMNKQALATLLTHPNNHPYDSGLIFVDSDGSISTWLAKEDERPLYYKNRVNAGMHIIDPAVLDLAIKNLGLDPSSIGTIDSDTGKAVKIDLDRQILKPLCGKHCVFAYDSPEYVKDMGTPERYLQVQQDFENGIIENKNLSHKQKAVFLDRDGTINRYVGFLRNINDLELLDGVAEAIRIINRLGYLAIVITNQPVIARGEVTRHELEKMHNKIETLLGEEGAFIDGIYYCPHHPDKGFEGEIKELKIECECRKPKPGLIFQASKDFNIDLSQSWMIGDSENDVNAGKAAGCKTAYISSSNSVELKSDIVAKNLLDAIKCIFETDKK